MSKQTYRVLRRYGPHAPGDELSLTEDEAIHLENEAPGLLEALAKADAAAPVVAPDASLRKAPKETA